MSAMVVTPDTLASLPDGLPVPVDDGAADHLPGEALPRLALVSTQGEAVDLSQPSGWVVVYCYPMTGRLGEALPEGWDDIPGARGCTPQSCSFRNLYGEVTSYGAQLFGVSAQSTAWQQEAAERLHLPFALLSDADLAFAAALRLPTFQAEGRTLLKRLTLIAFDGRIQKVYYPVFPPDKNAEDVLAWLRDHAERSIV